MRGLCPQGWPPQGVQRLQRKGLRKAALGRIKHQQEQVFAIIQFQNVIHETRTIHHVLLSADHILLLPTRGSQVK